MISAKNIFFVLFTMPIYKKIIILKCAQCLSLRNSLNDWYNIYEDH